MFGVVLWSNVNERKAVIWCEDQGDLAFFDGTLVWQDAAFAKFFDTGDLVKFDVSVDRNLRKATNAELVKGQGYSGLQDALKCDGSAPEYGGKVVPFGRTSKSPQRAVAPSRVKTVLPG